ncbi:RNA polymerase sigma factor [Chloroflexota bacterium]
MTDKSENWQTGDTTAFEVLFRQYEKLVFKTAFLITGNRDTAEDALQEVFVSVWKSRHTYDPNKGKLTTWLYRITVNQCLRKKSAKLPTTVPLDEKRMELPEIKHRSQPEDVLITKTEYERLLKTMNTLDNRHRSVLVLRYFNDLSYREIAGALEIPLGTVKSRLNNGLRQLKEQMNRGEASA